MTGMHKRYYTTLCVKYYVTLYVTMYNYDMYNTIASLYNTIIYTARNTMRSTIQLHAPIEVEYVRRRGRNTQTQFNMQGEVTQCMKL